MNNEANGAGCLLGVAGLVVAASCFAYYHAPRDEVTRNQYEHVAFLLDRDPGLRQVVASAMADGRVQRHEFFGVVAESERRGRDKAAAGLRRSLKGGDR